MIEPSPAASTRDAMVATGRTGPGPRVLVIEDEGGIVELLRVGLTYEGYRVTVTGDAETGLLAFAEGAFDLILLDLMLPDLDGLALCARMRELDPEAPIIIISARTTIPDRIAGLDRGADDYLIKPFSFDELLARIRAALRRRGRAPEATLHRGGGVLLNTETREVFSDGRPLTLTPIEFALLELFLRHPRRPFSRQTLRYRIWGTSDAGGANVVDVHVHRLRAKLGDRGRDLIRTVHRIGYVFHPDDHEPLA